MHPQPNDTHMAIAMLEHSKHALRSLAHDADGVALTDEHLPAIFQLIDVLNARIAQWAADRATARRTHQRRLASLLRLVEDIPA